MNKIDYDILNETERNYASVILPLMARTIGDVVKRDKLLKSYFDTGHGRADKPLPSYLRNYTLREHGINLDHFSWVN